MNGPRVVVVGAGVTGLAAACTLQDEATRRGAALSLRVLDAAAQAGGHAMTTIRDGFVIERGPNGFLDREPHTMALIEGLGLSPRLVEARAEAKRRFVLRDGQLRQVPGSPWSLFTTGLLSTRGAARVLLEPVAPAAPAGTDETVFAFAARRLGAEAAEILVDTAVSGISAGDSRQLSLAAQFPLLAEMERDHGSLVRAMFARRGRHAGPSRLLSFDHGLGVLTGAMTDRIGAALHTDSPVESLERAAHGWRIRVKGRPAIDADHVLVAAPARAAAPMVARLDGALATTMREIDYAGLVTVALGYRTADVRRPLDGYGYLVTRASGLATLGVVWESSLFPGRAPEGHALVRVMLGGVRGPGLVREDEATLVQRARAELAGPLGVTAAPVLTSIARWPDAIAQYTVGHQARVARLRDGVARFPGLTICGTSYDGVSFNHAVKSGRTAAHALAEHLWRGGQRAELAPADAALEA